MVKVVKDVISNVESIFDTCDKDGRRGMNDDKSYYVCREDLECPYKSDELTGITLIDHREGLFFGSKVYNLPICYYKNVKKVIE